MKNRYIISSANASADRKLNILTFPTHERYETQLCKTGHNFYSFRMENQKTWNTSQTPIPENYFLLPIGRIADYIDLDCILVQSKFWQYQISQKINEYLSLPVIVLEHTLPTSDQSSDQIDFMRNMLGNINVFISEYSQRCWNIKGTTKIIHHGIDTEMFCDKQETRENKVLSVANNFINRDYCLNFSGWRRITENLDVTLVGDNMGLSKPASSTEELADIYNKHSVFLNTSTHSPIPMSLLEAMSCGCAVVSSATCMIPDIITHGENGLISNDENELKDYISELLNNEDKARYLGNSARKTILEKFNEQDFIQNWQNTFNCIGDYR